MKKAKFICLCVAAVLFLSACDIVDNSNLTETETETALENRTETAALGISAYFVTKDTEYLITDAYHYIVSIDKNDEKSIEYIDNSGHVSKIPLSNKSELELVGILDYELYIAPRTGIRVIGAAEGFDAKEKLQIDDIIVAVNGYSCERMTILQEIIALNRTGDEIELDVFRNGYIVKLFVELGSASDLQ